MSKTTKPAYKVGKKYTVTRQNGEQITGTLVQLHDAGNGQFAELKYAPVGAKKGQFNAIRVRPSTMQPA
jgi:hypothetical protein